MFLSTDFILIRIIQEIELRCYGMTIRQLLDTYIEPMKENNDSVNVLQWNTEPQIFN